MSDCAKCEWTNNFKTCQDGSREAAKYDHDRHNHPDHTHVFGDSPYDWEQIGANKVQWNRETRSADIVLRDSTVQRCIVENCHISEFDFKNQTY